RGVPRAPVRAARGARGGAVGRERPRASWAQLTDRPELETDRLRLRQFRDGDLDAYAQITRDPETMRYIARGEPLDREQARRSLGYVLAHWQVRGYGLWAAEEKVSSALVGRIGLLRREGWRDLELAWLIARERWGEGFATEGARAALDHAF